MPRIADEGRIGCMVLCQRSEIVLEYLIDLEYSTLSNVLYFAIQFF